MDKAPRGPDILKRKRYYSTLLEPTLSDAMRSLAARTRPLLSVTLLVVASLLLAGCGGPNLFERMSTPYWGVCGTIIIVLDIVALVDLLGDDRREFGGKLLWTLLVVFFPVGGLILYYLFGRD